MHAKRRVRRGHVALALALAAAAALLIAASCTGRSAPTTSAATPELPVSPRSPAPTAAATASAPTEPGFDYADPGEVARRFVAALYSTDTTRDPDSSAAAGRAAQYVTARLAGQGFGVGHDARWQTWAAHQARLELQLATHPDPHQHPDTSVTALRPYRIAATAVGADGWRGWTEHSFIYCALKREPGGWRVDRYDVYPAPPPR